jgi:hypothetical protein
MDVLFVGGCPRSGTTMLAHQLASHLPSSVVTPESPFKTSMLDWALSDGRRGDPDPVDDWRFRIWGIDPPPFRVPPRSDHQTERLHLVRGRLTEYVTTFAGTADSSDLLWIDHTPNNARYSERLHLLFPRSHQIHIIRDGRAVFASVNGLDWGPTGPEECARWWLQFTAACLAASSAGRSDVVRYEDVVDGTEPPFEIASEVARALGRPLNAEREPVSWSVPRYTAEQHRLVGGEPVESRVDTWRQILRRRDVERFEWVAGDVLVGLGYAPDHPAPRGASRSERLRAALASATKRRIQRVRRRRRRSATVSRGRR